MKIDSVYYRQLQFSRTGDASLLLSHATCSPTYHSDGRRSRRHARNALYVRRGVGFEVCNGLEAVEAALREKPQLILRDSRLPFIGVHAITQRLWRQVVTTPSKNLLTSKGSEHTWPALNLRDGYLAPLCRISVLSQEVKCQHHGRRYQQ